MKIKNAIDERILHYLLWSTAALVGFVYLAATRGIIAALYIALFFLTAWLNVLFLTAPTRFLKGRQDAWGVLVFSCMVFFNTLNVIVLGDYKLAALLTWMPAMAGVVAVFLVGTKK